MKFPRRLVVGVLTRRIEIAIAVKTDFDRPATAHGRLAGEGEKIGERLRTLRELRTLDEIIRRRNGKTDDHGDDGSHDYELDEGERGLTVGFHKILGVEGWAD